MRRLWVIAVACWGTRGFAEPPIEASVADAVATKLTFDPGRTSLTATAKAALKPVFDTLQARPALRIVIVGHFDAETSAHMDVTAKRRAEVVKWALVDAGIEVDRIETSVSAVMMPGKVIELHFGGAGAPEPKPMPAAFVAAAPSDDIATLATRVTFDAGRAALTPAAKAALKPVFELLRARPASRLVVVGHINAETQVTAKRRAEVVKWYLVDAGIETDRIETNVSAAAGKAIELQLDGTAKPAVAPPVAAPVAVPVAVAVARPEPMHVVEVAPLAHVGQVADVGSAAPDFEHDSQDASQLARLLGDDGGDRHAGANLYKELEDTRNQHITIGADEAGFRGDSSPHAATIHAPGLELHLPMLVSSTAKHGEDDIGRTMPGSPGDAVTSPADGIASRLRARYMRGMGRCYRKSLTSDPELSGRVAISFAIDEAGRVVGPVIDSDDTELDNCIRAQTKTWRFEIAHDRKGAPTRATFSTNLLLRSK